MFRITTSLAAIALVWSSSVWAAESSASDPPGFWTNPAIAGYGRVHDLPQSAYRPDAKQTYHVVFSVTRGSQKPGEINPSLDRVARTVNLYAASGVPLKQLKFVAIISGEATSAVLDDEHYKSANGEANPNLALIAALRKAGVDVAVCGQAVAEHKYQYEWVDRSVTLALSALTTITTLEERGYHLVQL